MWAAQYHSKRYGWYIPFNVKRTRTDAINEWKNMWTDPKYASRKWHKYRKQGRVRCVRVTITAPTD